MLHLVQRLTRRSAATSTETSAKQTRISVSDAESSELRSAAVARTRTKGIEASFLVVAAGLLAGAAGTEFISEDTWILGVIPLIMTLATVVISAFAR